MADLRDYLIGRLRVARERSGLTEEQIGARCGLHVRTVRRVFAGDTCALDTVQTVARVLRVEW